MKYATLIVRLLVGLMLLVFGLNKYLGFLPPPDLSPEAKQAFGGLASAGFIFAIVPVVEIVCGALLLVGRWVALASVVMFPVALSAFLFHLLHDLSGIAPAAIWLVGNVYLLLVHARRFAPILSPK